MQDQLAYRPDSQEWNNFFSHWSRDPVGMVNLCGHTLGRNAMFTEDFFNAYGQSLFAYWKIPERIDFMYGLSNFEPDPLRLKDFSEMVSCGVTSNIPWIIDVDGTYHHIGIALFHGLDTEQDIYSIRIFLPEDYELDPPENTWNGPLDSFEGITGRLLEVGNQECPHYIAHGDAFWNFSKSPSGVEVSLRSVGFQDMAATKRVANLLLWTTNMLGFQI